MKTIKEVFVENLRRLRGVRTQAEIAEAAKIPLRSYQNAEINGSIPQGPNLAAIAGAFGVQETELFLDPDLLESRGSRGELILEIVQVLPSLDEPGLEALRDAALALKATAGASGGMLGEVKKAK